MISICLPTLNARAYLKERIDSILSQTTTDWELVACDSYSDDGTWEYLQQFKSDPRFRLYQVPREGLYAGWNECLKRVKGEFVHFATADDTCSPHFLESLVTLLQRHPQAELAFSDFSHVDINGAEVCDKRMISTNREKFFSNFPGRVMFLNQAITFVASCHYLPLWHTMSAVVFRASLVSKIGTFPVSFGSSGDTYWAFAAATTTPFILVNEKLATWRRHPEQATYSQKDHILYLNTYHARIAARLDYKEKIQSFFPGFQNLDSLLYSYQDKYIQSVTCVNREMLKRSLFKSFKHLIWSFRHWPLFTLTHALKGFHWIQLPSSLSYYKEISKTLGLPEPEVLE